MNGWQTHPQGLSGWDGAPNAIVVAVNLMQDAGTGMARRVAGAWERDPAACPARQGQLARSGAVKRSDGQLTSIGRQEKWLRQMSAALVQAAAVVAAAAEASCKETTTGSPYSEKRWTSMRCVVLQACVQALAGPRPSLQLCRKKQTGRGRLSYDLQGRGDCG